MKRHNAAIALGVGAATAAGLALLKVNKDLIVGSTAVVVGTSLFQIIFVTANVTFLQSITTQTVDIILAGLLMLGGVIGAQFGSNASSLLRGEQLRGLLALLVLAVCIKLFMDLTLAPTDIFSLEILR